MIVFFFVESSRTKNLCPLQKDESSSTFEKVERYKYKYKRYKYINIDINKDE